MELWQTAVFQQSSDAAVNSSFLVVVVPFSLSSFLPFFLSFFLSSFFLFFVSSFLPLSLSRPEQVVKLLSWLPIWENGKGGSTPGYISGENRDISPSCADVIAFVFVDFTFVLLALSFVEGKP